MLPCLERLWIEYCVKLDTVIGGVKGKHNFGSLSTHQKDVGFLDCWYPIVLPRKQEACMDSSGR